MKQSSTPLLVLVAPAIFVFLWATGFIVAKFGTAEAEPFSFLALRFGITAVILFVFVTVSGRLKEANHNQILHSVIVGCLLHGLYLGGVFWAIDNGLPSGISALVVALQPFVTALVAWSVMGEKLSALKALFFATALFGVGLVLFPDLGFVDFLPGITWPNIIASLIATVAISSGAVYQKRAVTSLDLWVSTAAQFVGATFVTGLLALSFETGQIVFTLQTVLSFVWLIFFLSIGAVALLMYLIRRGDTASVASLFYLVPVVAMFMAWILFDERLVTMQFAGSAIVVASVAAASRVK